jgi:hypothetical protein
MLPMASCISRDVLSLSMSRATVNQVMVILLGVDVAEVFPSCHGTTPPPARQCAARPTLPPA